MATAESPEYKSMRLVTHYLAVGVKAPLQLAGELFSERLICEDTLEKAGLECHTTYKRMTDVLSDVRSVIAAHPAAYEKLRKIFSRKPYLRHLADLMRDKLDEVRSGLHHEVYQVLQHSVIHKYITYLKDYYKTHFTRPGGDGKWPNIQIDRYIKLSVAENVHFSEKEVARFSLSSAKEGIDKLVGKRKTVGIDSIACLTANNEPHKGVLIIGAPGIGKTSLVRQLCLEWAQGKLLQHYDLVLLLQLRDKYVLEAKSIGSILNPDDPDCGQDIFKHIRETSDRLRILLIFDGYDEAHVELKGSRVERLMEWKSLPKATVLITSRPITASGLVRNREFDQKLEVLGFTKQNIYQYAEASFSGTETLYQFKLFLRSHPHILAMMYNPLNCAIVTEAYKHSFHFSVIPPNCTTDLYTNLTLSLLSRYSSVRHTGYDNLPEDVADRFWRLATLAYNCLLKKEFVFTDKSVPEDLIQLGFFQSYPHMYSHKDACSSHSFLHLTLQEYLAALHVSRCSHEEQYAFLKSTSQLGGIEKVFDFLAGLTCLCAFHPEQLEEIYGQFGQEALKVSLPGSLVCYKSHESPLISALFETQSPDVIKKHFCYFTSDLPFHTFFYSHFHTPIHYYIIGYLLAVTHHSWVIYIGELSSDIAHCFNHGFEAGGGLCSTRQIKKLTTTSNYSNFDDVLRLPRNILENVVRFELRRLHDCSTIQFSNLLKAMTRLESIECFAFPMSTINLKLDAFLNVPSVAAFISSLEKTGHQMYISTTLKYSKIVHLFFLSKLQSIIGTVPWLQVVQDNDDIKVQLCVRHFSPNLPETFLWFGATFVSKRPKRVKRLPVPIHHGRSRIYQSFTVSFSFMYTPYSYQVSLGTLNTVSHLSTISMTGSEHLHCFQPTIALLCHTLHNNLLPNVTSLDLSHTPISSAIIRHLSPALSHNHHLLRLRLAHCSLSLRALSFLTSSLQWNRSLRELELSGNRMVTRRRGLVEIASLLSRSCNLRTVVLQDCGFIPIRAHQLSTFLYKLGILRHTHLVSDLVILLHVDPVPTPQRCSISTHPHSHSSRLCYCSFSLLLMLIVFIFCIWIWFLI